MGTDGEDGKGPGQFSVQGCAESFWESAAPWERRDLVLTFSGGSDEGGRDRLDSDVNPLEAEYGCAIYCDAADSGPVQKGQPTAERTGNPEVVGTDGDLLEGSAREGGSSRSDESRNEGVYGLVVGGQRHNGQDRGRHRGGGVPGRKRVQWSGVERSGAGRRTTNTLTSIEQGAPEVT